MEFYRIQYGSYVFYAKIELNYGNNPNDETVSVSIGSKKSPRCVWILLDSPIATTGILQNVSYDETCASNQPMPRKTGTRAMMRAAFAFVKHRFPKVADLTYTDMSSFLCDGKKVATANMSFILDGKTWYEKHFHAEAENKESYEMLKHLYAESNLHAVPFQRLWEQSLDLTKIPKKTLHDLYASSATWRAFYKAIYNAYQCAPFIPITTNYPFTLFCSRMKTLSGETWRLPLTAYEADKTLIVDTLDARMFPEMDWKPLEKRQIRMYGGLNKTRRKHQMFLG